MRQVVRKESHPAKPTIPHTEGQVSDLMLAVLEDAMRTFKDGVNSAVPAKRVEAFKVEAWVMSDDTDWPFAFVNVCEAIGLSADYVRTAMAKWRRKRVRNEHQDWMN